MRMSDSKASSQKYTYKYFLPANRPVWTKNEEPSKEAIQTYVDEILGLKKKPDTSKIPV
jgi:hypothetical protein